MNPLNSFIDKAGSVLGGIKDPFQLGEAVGQQAAMSYMPTQSASLGGAGLPSQANPLGSWGTMESNGLLGTGNGTQNFGNSQAMSYAPTQSQTLSTESGVASGLDQVANTGNSPDLQQLLAGIGALGQSLEGNTQQQTMQAPTVQIGRYRGTKVPTAYERAMAQLPQVSNAITKNKFM